APDESTPAESASPSLAAFSPAAVRFPPDPRSRQGWRPGGPPASMAQQPESWLGAYATRYAFEPDVSLSPSWPFRELASLPGPICHGEWPRVAAWRWRPCVSPPARASRALWSWSPSLFEQSWP